MNKIEKAKQFAIKAHGDQMYGDNPYIYHLDQVAGFVKEYSNDWDVYFQEQAHIVAYLHDVLEDTNITKDMLATEFGLEIANLVDNLTDVPGKNRKERKLNTWYKIRKHNISVFVKLCDRIANTNESVMKSNSSLLQMYQKEFPLFEAALFVPGQFDRMWDDLRKVTFR